MKRYLIFDAHCSVCKSLARAIEEVAGSNLEAISIRDDKARVLLDQVYPAGWEHAPYLVMVDRGKVRAWTGRKMAWRLAWLLGPPKAWEVWTLARRYGVFSLVGGNVVNIPNASRRQFLKKSVAAGFTAFLLSLLSSSVFNQDAHAGTCSCFPSYCGCIVWSESNGCTCHDQCGSCYPGCTPDRYVTTTCYCALECGGVRYCMIIYCYQCGTCV